MSNYSRKIQLNSRKKTVMKSSEELYFLEGMPIKVVNYNSKYYEDAEHISEAYGLVFSDYFTMAGTSQVPFIEFLQDSVEKNYMLSDSLRECDFTIIDEHIYFQDIDDEKIDFINMGQFIFCNCKINACHSYLFVEDLATGIKYLYYGD